MADSYTDSVIAQYINFNIPKKARTLIVSAKSRQKVFVAAKKVYDYIVLVDIVEKEQDILTLLSEVSKYLSPQGRLIIIYRNYLQSFFSGFLFSKNNYNWLSTYDIKTFLRLSDFETITQSPLCLISFDIPFITDFINRLLLYIYPFNHLAFMQTIVARKIRTTICDRSVSIIVPARNEEGNIERLIKKLPPVGTTCEVIFVEGHSKDNTLLEIKRCIKKYSKMLPFSFKVIKQTGVGKANAVRGGFDAAIGDILIIYDADMSVNPQDIVKFYLALITYKGEFINGSRLVYSMEKNAMQFLNILGNKIFSLLYSWILGQKIKDTLCGTKVLWKQDYQKIKTEDFFGHIDPFGDFELLLGAGKLNLKIIDLPIRYFERTYGSTNIKRFKNGLELARFSLIAIQKLKMRLP